MPCDLSRIPRMSAAQLAANREAAKKKALLEELDKRLQERRARITAQGKIEGMDLGDHKTGGICDICAIRHLKQFGSMRVRQLLAKNQNVKKMVSR